MNIPVLHLDKDLLVIDKPAGLAVHPGPRTPRSLEDHLDALRFGARHRPQPAHRLDRDTSGCLALGRTPRAVRRLNALFAAGEIGKEYWAGVDGSPVEDSGRINLPLLKVSSAADGWRMVVDDRGKPSVTRWRVLARGRHRSLVAFTPETGRTHQIRVHAASLGHPVAGDPVYGSSSGPMLLHSRALTIPLGAGPVRVTAPLPGRFAAAGVPLPPGA